MINIENRSTGAIRALLLGSVAIFSLSVPGSAWAQDSEEALPAADGSAEAEDQGDGNEIVVTATKREQTLQDVPVAVSVTTAETIERAQIRDIRDLQTLVPSLRVGERQNSTNTNFFIRGFGNGANNAGIEPSVGVFVDGVYRSRSAAQITDLPDVQRIEVLRGPQSTLFGKNASAGVISIVTAKPKFTFGGNTELSYGNYNALVMKGVVTGPISENVAASLAAGVNRRDGYFDNLGTGNKTNNRKRWFVRGQLLIEPSEGLSVRLIGDYSKIDELCCGVANVQAGQSTAILTSPLIGGKVNAPADRFNNQVYTNFDSTNRIENYGFSGQIDYETGPLTFTSITALRKSTTDANFDSDFTSADLLRGANIGYVDLKTFTQELRVSANFVDKVNVLLGGFYFNEKVNQETHLRWGTAARPYFDQLIRGATGGALNIGLLENTFGLSDAAAALNPALATRYVGQFFAAGQGMDEVDTLKNEYFSVFSQVDFDVTDRLTLTGGIAYSNDKKRFTDVITTNDAFAGVNFNAPQYAVFRNQLILQGGVAQQVGTALGLGRSATAAEITAFATGTSPAGAAGATAYPTIVAGATAFANANQNNPLANPLNALSALQIFAPYVPELDGRTSDDKFTYTARVAYDVTDNINAYASFATGYKASSVNLSRDSRPGARSAGPENSTVYEAGIKGSWPNAAFNLAVFHQAIKGFQSNIFTGLGFVLANAGKQSVRGFELDGMYRPVSGLTFSGAVTYLSPKYDDFKQSAFGDATGIRPSDIPAWSFTVGAEYEHELANAAELIGRVSFHHESKVQVVEGLPGFIAKNAVTGAVLPGGYQLGLDAAKPFTREVNELEASLTYAMQNGFEFTLWGRNLTNSRNISTIFDSPAQSGSVSAYPNQPRTWGGSVRYRW